MGHFSFAWFKEHPWLTGVVVVVGGFLFLSLSGILGGGGSTGPVTVTGASDAEIAAQSQQQQIQAAQAVASQQSSDQLEETKITTEAQLSALNAVLAASAAQGSNGSSAAGDGVTINGKIVSYADLPTLNAENQVVAAQAKAAGLGTLYDPHYGAIQNEVPNAVLAQVTGYTGNFGGGAFETWITQQDQATQAKAQGVLISYGESNRVVGFGSTSYGNST